MSKPKLQEISVQHQEDKTQHKFFVADSKNLTDKEVKRICQEMGVHALFVEGKYYSGN
jgi:ribonuclease HIII